MDRFEELLNLWREGGDDVPDTIYDDLLAVHREGRDEECPGCAERDDTIRDLKSRNYDLLVSGGRERRDAKDDRKRGDRDRKDARRDRRDGDDEAARRDDDDADWDDRDADEDDDDARRDDKDVDIDDLFEKKDK